MVKAQFINANEKVNMPERTHTDHAVAIEDDLAVYARSIEAAREAEDFSTVADLMEQNWASA